MKTGRSKSVGRPARPHNVADLVGIFFVRAFAESGVPDRIRYVRGGPFGGVEECAIRHCRTTKR